MKRSQIVVGALLASGLMFTVVSSANSAGDPVVERQAIMKAFGTTMKDASGLSSGRTPWNPALAKSTMTTAAANAKKLKTLFPTDTGANPKAFSAPAVWTAKADFNKRLDDLAAAATAGAKATDAAGMKASVATIGASCKSCHDVYRKKMG
jgi:cytochrome c556